MQHPVAGSMAAGGWYDGQAPIMAEGEPSAAHAGETFWTEFEAIGWQGNSANVYASQSEHEHEVMWAPGAYWPGTAYRSASSVPLLKPGKPMDIAIRFNFFAESASVAAMLPDEVAAFRGGKNKLQGFFVGQLMKKTGGKADPKLANQILSKKLKGE